MFENHLLAIILIYTQAFRPATRGYGIYQILKEDLFAGLTQDEFTQHAHMLSIADHRLNATQKTHDITIERNIEQAGGYISDIVKIRIEPTFKLLVRQGMCNLDFIQKFQTITEKIYKNVTFYLAANTVWQDNDGLKVAAQTNGTDKKVDWGRREIRTALYIPDKSGTGAFNG